jgi:hypothetical protein
MKEFRFSGDAMEALRRISAGLVGITVNYVSGSQITDIVLWLACGGHVAIFNRMHDVKERFEVGTLNFTLGQDDGDIPEVLTLPNEFCSELKIERLVLIDPDVRAESGILIWTTGRDCIKIVAAAGPCTLSVEVSGLTLPASAPEYPLDTYVRRPL